MNRQSTQAAVAILSIIILGMVTLLAAGAYLFNDSPSELAFALVGGLTGITGQASAYLFRLNGATPPGG